MPKEKHLNADPETSSDEEDPIIDDDTCTPFEIENAFPLKYKIADESAASLKKVYVLHLCADKCFGRIAAGLSDNTAQIYEINSGALTRLPSNGIFNLKNTEGAVCGVRFFDETPNNLLVGSTNGAVYLYDLRTGKSEISFEDPQNRFTITSFDMNASNRVICSGTDQLMNEIHLQFFDVRKNTLLGVYFESHQDDVTDVKFHPTDPDLLCTGSIDGLINYFDISVISEDEALITTMNTESSVGKLNWHKNVYEKDYISCITHSNDLKTYECEEGDLIAEFERSQITESIKRKSVVDCNLVSCHNTHDGGVFLLATSNFHKGEVVRSVQLQGKNLSPYGLFDGNKQIIRSSLFDAKSNLLVTGGESGIVSLWSPSSAEQPPPPVAGRNKLKAKTKASKAHGSTPY